MKKITLLGSTGTIGINALSVIRKNREQFSVFALVTDRNAEIVKDQIEEFSPKFVVINDESGFRYLKEYFAKSSVRILKGRDGIKEVVESDEVHIVISAISGTSGIYPTYRAVKAGKFVALANKESLVSAGELIKEEAKKNKAKIIPVDSEHSAIFQLINGKKHRDIKRIILPASGGPFLDKDIANFEHITVSDALNHPVWNMGKKITIDSATLANKGLEVIEAHYLFDLPYEKIDVLIHRQCIVHGMVELIDGSMLTHMGKPDMKLPISYALHYPRREYLPTGLNLGNISNLTFEEVSVEKFPFLSLAYDVGRKKKSYPAIFNSADDRAVHYFLNGLIGFKDIFNLVNDAVNNHNPFDILDIGAALEADRLAKEYVDNKVKRIRKI